MIDFLFALVMFAASVALCPLLLGVVNRVKAFFGGRRGPPLVQVYRDIAKLAAKDAVYSDASTWIFRACPVAVLAAALAAGLLTPQGGPALLSFQGDFLVWVGAFTMARVFMILAGLDVGSSFEGMGGSREAWFAALAEPALFLAMAALAVISGARSLSGFYLALTPRTSGDHIVVLLFAALAIFLAALAENARIPVDDPATHLELTMVHEVMILDHSGPDLAILTYGSALKLWVMGALAVGMAVPVQIGSVWLDAVCFLAGMLAFALAVGVVESVMARMRFGRVPQFLVGAAVLASLAIIMAVRSY